MAIQQNDRSFSKIFNEVEIQTIPPKYIQAIILTLSSGEKVEISEEMLDSIQSAEDVFAGIAREDVVNVDIALDYDAIEHDVSTDVKSVLDGLFGTHD
jgi:hypothetical protein|tara:strand:+ start:1031 stop:1324 length:294 start_codon:yes stop_codon:yes gene_type:complete